MKITNNVAAHKVEFKLAIETLHFICAREYKSSFKNLKFNQTLEYCPDSIKKLRYLILKNMKLHKINKDHKNYCTLISTARTKSCIASVLGYSSQESYKL